MGDTDSTAPLAEGARSEGPPPSYSCSASRSTHIRRSRGRFLLPAASRTPHDAHRSRVCHRVRCEPPRRDACRRFLGSSRIGWPFSPHACRRPPRVTWAVVIAARVPSPASLPRHPVSG